MRIDTRDKRDALRQCLEELRSNSQIAPFLVTEEISKFGIYDFLYINKNPPSFASVDRNLRDEKYLEIGDFVEDVRRIFISVSDYVFTDDPIQKTCMYFLQKLWAFENKFIERFSYKRPEPDAPRKKIISKPKEIEEKIKKQTSKEIIKEAIPKEVVLKEVKEVKHKEIFELRQRRANLAEKLQMIFLLGAHSSNESYIRSIGESLGIGRESAEDYTVTLDNKNSNWLKFISKNS